MNNNEIDLSASPNLLLQGLTAEDKRLLQPLLQRHMLTPKMFLEKRHTRLEKVYFVEEGLAVVLVGPSQEHQEGVGIIGRCGLVGSVVAVGIDHVPYDTMMLIGGRALGVDLKSFQDIMYRSVTLRNRMLRFNQAFMVHAAQLGLAKSHGSMKDRLACWLLMAHDRISGDELQLTHETISTVLGVRRASVTVALHELEGDRVIHSLRGWIAIRDRKGLERAAGSFYGPAEAEYEQLLEIPLTKLTHDEGEGGITARN